MHDDNCVYAFADVFDNTMIPVGGSITKQTYHQGSHHH